MRAERQLLRLGEFMVGLACRHLPERVRQERYREWTAELPAILHDGNVRPGARRAICMLGYAADTFRGAAMPTKHGSKPRGARRLNAVWLLLAVGSLALVAGGIWNIARAPGDAQNYLLLAWSCVLAAYPIGMLTRAAARVTVPLCVSINLAGVGSGLWNAAGGDWAGYLQAAWLLALLLTWWLVYRWARARQA